MDVLADFSHLDNYAVSVDLRFAMGLFSISIIKVPIDEQP